MKTTIIAAAVIVAEAKAKARLVRIGQLVIQFGAASKRYMEMALSGDVRGMLAVGLQVQESMERVAKAVTNTEVADD